ncbi:MAG: N-acetylmuramoyl-L-alanine amidase [Anaerolineaceae bacterium]|nr:N-acetylmuramoyl-L-alanine amidase [Anaerolineaceae bacterium]
MENDLNYQEDQNQEDLSSLSETPEMENVPEQALQPKRTKLGTMGIIQTVVSAAFIVATLFTIWSPSSLVSKSLEERISEALVVDVPEEDINSVTSATPDPLIARRIGIVVGHQGNDSGAVCPDGLREVDINSKVATFVQQRLIGLGYDVILLDEMDTRLNNFQGVILLSIHADSCDYVNDLATGFKVSAALSEVKFENSTRLVNCISDRYKTITGLIFHYQSITNDMTYYHAFDEINPLTTAAIIETGFMNLDRQTLTEKPELIAEGIVAGIACYLNNESIQSTATPTGQ